MPSDPVEDAIYLGIEQAIEENYRGADGSYPVSPSAVAGLATSAALAAIEAQGKVIVDAERATPPAGPALRNCLVPGCLAQYDAIAALTGEQPARPEWSSEGWRILRSGMAFPGGGHVCPTHAQTVIEHLPRRATPGEAGWVQGDCACGDWTSPRQRWHGAVRGLWEEHLLDAMGTWEASR